MPEDRFPVLFLDGATRTTGFTSPQQGGGGARPPERVREHHAENVRQKLESAWKEDRNRLAAAHSTREGCYLEFVGSAGADLAVKSLEFLRSGIRLRNVRIEQTEQGDRTLATVYVPAEKRGHFLRKIRAYETEDHPKSGRPKNESLIASIEDVRAAILDEF